MSYSFNFSNSNIFKNQYSCKNIQFKSIIDEKIDTADLTTNNYENIDESMIPKYYNNDLEDIKTINQSNVSLKSKLRSTSQPSFTKKTWSIVNFEDQPGIEFDLDYKFNRSLLPEEYSAFCLRTSKH